MISHRVTESEIVDVLMGQADAEVDERVRERIRNDRKFAALYDYWTHLIPAIEEERGRVRTVTNKACQRLMAQLNEERPPRAAAVLPGETGSKVWRIRGVATAASVLLCIGCLILLLLSFGDESAMPTLRYPVDENRGRTLEKSIAYVDFSADLAAEPGTSSRPFKRITDAIAAVSNGGIVRIRSDVAVTLTPETLRIAKPVRIEAVGGRVRIGTNGT